jgi:wyosine [tRNA(Phe)-imidazoG37] synthetase (radical SAM superfamily)
VLSNSSTATRPWVQAGLALADERYMKLDAGNQQLLRRLNGTGASLTAIVNGLRHLDDVVVQSMFVRDPSGVLDNSGPDDVDAWIAALCSVRPTGVDIYTLDRAPALERLRPVDAGRLQEIANLVEDAGLIARVCS